MSSTKELPATPALKDAWSATHPVGRAVGLKGTILIVEVLDEYTAKAVERLNLYNTESFGEMLRAGFYVKRVACKVAVSA